MSNEAFDKDAVDSDEFNEFRITSFEKPISKKNLLNTKAVKKTSSKIHKLVNTRNRKLEELDELKRELENLNKLDSRLDVARNKYTEAKYTEADEKLQALQGKSLLPGDIENQKKWQKELEEADQAREKALLDIDELSLKITKTEEEIEKFKGKISELKEQRIKQKEEEKNIQRGNKERTNNIIAKLKENPVVIKDNFGTPDEAEISKKYRVTLPASRATSYLDIPDNKLSLIFPVLTENWRKIEENFDVNEEEFKNLYLGYREVEVKIKDKEQTKIERVGKLVVMSHGGRHHKNRKEISLDLKNDVLPEAVIATFRKVNLINTEATSDKVKKIKEGIIFKKENALMDNMDNYLKERGFVTKDTGEWLTTRFARIGTVNKRELQVKEIKEWIQDYKEGKITKLALLYKLSEIKQDVVQDAKKTKDGGYDSKIWNYLNDYISEIQQENFKTLSHILTDKNLQSDTAHEIFDNVRNAEAISMFFGASDTDIQKLIAAYFVSLEVKAISIDNELYRYVQTLLLHLDTSGKIEKTAYNISKIWQEIINPLFNNQWRTAIKSLQNLIAAEGKDSKIVETAIEKIVSYILEVEKDSVDDFDQLSLLVFAINGISPKAKASVFYSIEIVVNRYLEEIKRSHEDNTKKFDKLEILLGKEGVIAVLADESLKNSKIWEHIGQLTHAYLKELIKGNKREEIASIIEENKSLVSLGNKIFGTREDILPLLLEALSDDLTVYENQNKFLIEMLSKFQAIPAGVVNEEHKEIIKATTDRYLEKLFEAKNYEKISEILAQGYVYKIGGVVYGDNEKVKQVLLEQVKKYGENESLGEFSDEETYRELFQRAKVAFPGIEPELVQAYKSSKYEKLYEELIKLVTVIGEGNLSQIPEINFELFQVVEALGSGAFVLNENLDILVNKIEETIFSLKENKDSSVYLKSVLNYLFFLISGSFSALPSERKEIGKQILSNADKYLAFRLSIASNIEQITSVLASAELDSVKDFLDNLKLQIQELLKLEPTVFVKQDISAILSEVFEVISTFIKDKKPEVGVILLVNKFVNFFKDEAFKSYEGEISVYLDKQENFAKPYKLCQALINLLKGDKPFLHTNQELHNLLVLAGIRKEEEGLRIPASPSTEELAVLVNLVTKEASPEDSETVKAAFKSFTESLLYKYHETREEHKNESQSKEQLKQDFISPDWLKFFISFNKEAKIFNDKSSEVKEDNDKAINQIRYLTSQKYIESIKTPEERHRAENLFSQAYLNIMLLGNSAQIRELKVRSEVLFAYYLDMYQKENNKSMLHYLASIIKTILLPEDERIKILNKLESLRKHEVNQENKTLSLNEAKQKYMNSVLEIKKSVVYFYEDFYQDVYSKNEFPVKDMDALCNYMQRSGAYNFEGLENLLGITQEGEYKQVYSDLLVNEKIELLKPLVEIKLKLFKCFARLSHDNINLNSIQEDMAEIEGKFKILIAESEKDMQLGLRKLVYAMYLRFLKFKAKVAVYTEEGQNIQSNQIDIVSEAQVVGGQNKKEAIKQKFIPDLGMALRNMPKDEFYIFLKTALENPESKEGRYITLLPSDDLLSCLTAFATPQVGGKLVKEYIERVREAVKALVPKEELQKYQQDNYETNITRLNSLKDLIKDTSRLADNVDSIKFRIGQLMNPLFPGFEIKIIECLFNNKQNFDSVKDKDSVNDILQYFNLENSDNPWYYLQESYLTAVLNYAESGADKRGFQTEHFNQVDNILKAAFRRGLSDTLKILFSDFIKKGERGEIDSVGVYGQNLWDKVISRNGELRNTLRNFVPEKKELKQDEANNTLGQTTAKKENQLNILGAVFKGFGNAFGNKQ